MNKRKLLLLITFLFLICYCYGCNDEGTSLSDSLKLQDSYEGKTFVEDGLGKVELLKTVDGDTIHVIEDGQTYKIRFLCVNTPESTGSIDPWGNEAKEFTKERIDNAYEIVLESEKGLGTPPEIDTTGGRLLAYVWYRKSANSELKCLNLELVENCYSYYTSISEIHDEEFRNVYNSVRESGKKIFGELDPNFNYDTEIKEVTIAQVKQNFSSFSTGNNLKVTAQIVRVCGKSVYVFDTEETVFEDERYLKDGIYVFHNYTDSFKGLKPGDVVSLQCQATYSDDYGYQFTNPKKVRTVSSDELDEDAIIQVSNDTQSLEQYEGRVVKANKVTINSVGNANDEGAYTLYCSLENGTEINIRINSDLVTKPSRDSFDEGDQINIIGGVSRYVDHYDEGKLYFQIVICNAPFSSGDIVKIIK